jgi:hypothetical protein
LKTVPTSGPNVLDRRGNDAREVTKDDVTRREVSASAPPEPDAVEAALAGALKGATDAGRWDVVAQLARELEARRTARAGNVVPLDGRARRRDAGR